MQVCKYTSMKICTHMQLCKYASMQICMYESMCKHVSMQVCVSMQLCKNASMQVYASMQVCKYASMQVCKFAHIYVCKYAHWLDCALCKVRHRLIVCTLCKAIFPTCQIGNMVTKRAKFMPIHIEVKAQRLCMFALRHFFQSYCPPLVPIQSNTTI